MFSLTAGLFQKITGNSKTDQGNAPPNGSIPQANGHAISSNTNAASAPDLLLQEYICASPLLSPCGFTPSDVAATLPQWRARGEEIARNLRFPSTAFSSLDDTQRSRIYQYYLPVYFWVNSQLTLHRQNPSTQGPLVVGISAPQGCGKSTLCEQLEALFTSSGLVAASLSIDDFYLTYEQQQAIKDKYSGNPLLQMRGNAGTHDLELGTRTLRALQGATGPTSSVPLPRYNKSAYQGMGDSADPSIWPVVKGKVDIVLFEGWMFGFSAVDDENAVTAVDPHLTPVNAFLKEYQRAWDSFVDTWLVVRVSDPQYAYQWRLQAERAMRAAGKPAMTDEQVAQFVDRFMPAYRCYLPGLYKNGPTTAKKGKLLVVQVDEHRCPVEKQPSPIM